jgi:hypothetical protein
VKQVPHAATNLAKDIADGANAILLQPAHARRV